MIFKFLLEIKELESIIKISEEVLKLINQKNILTKSNYIDKRWYIVYYRRYKNIITTCNFIVYKKLSNRGDSGDKDRSLFYCAVELTKNRY